MKSITPQTEQKLMGVIEQTSDLVAEGLSPNAAIIKAAAGRLHPSEIELVAHAYNTGQTTRRRKDSDDLFTKSAEFPLADAKAIMAELFPENVKTASAVQEEAALSTEYSYSPRSMLSRKAVWEKKATHVNWREINGQQVTAPAPLPRDPTHQLKVAMARVDRLKRTVEEQRRQKSAAFDALGQAFMRLSDYFRRPDSFPLPVVKEAVTRLHGQQGTRIMEELVRVTPALEKLARHHTGRSMLGTAGPSQFAVTADDLDCTAEPFPMVYDVIQHIRAYNEKCAEFQATCDQYDKEAGEAIAPFAHPSGSPSILDTSPSEGRPKIAGIPSPLQALGAYSLVRNTLGDAANKVKGPDDSQQVSSVLTALNDPDHEAKLRSINAQALLQDLLANDEIISGYPPEVVTDAYNDLVQVSPSIADQKLPVQTMLRKQLQQGTLDSFEQGSLLGMESQLRDQNKPLVSGKTGYGPSI